MRLGRRKGFESDGGVEAAASPSNRRLLVQRSLLEKTHRVFFDYWLKGFEGVAYWHGMENDRGATDIALALVVPESKNTLGNFEVTTEETTRMGHLMAKKGLVCLAQVHTHPGMLLSQSKYDEQHALSRRDGFLSLIVPEYGNVSLYDLENVSVHESWAGSWVSLDKIAKGKRVQIVDDFLDLRLKSLVY